MSINIERLKLVQQSIKTETQLHFNMNKYRTDCGSAGCIAGHAIFLFAPDVWAISGEIEGYKLQNLAQNLLGLSERNACDLFTSSSVYGNKVTPQIAVDVIQGLIDTREIKWPEEVYLSYDPKEPVDEIDIACRGEKQ